MPAAVGSTRSGPPRKVLDRGQPGGLALLHHVGVVLAVTAIGTSSSPKGRENKTVKLELLRTHRSAAASLQLTGLRSEKSLQKMSSCPAFSLVQIRCASMCTSLRPHGLRATAHLRTRRGSKLLHRRDERKAERRRKRRVSDCLGVLAVYSYPAMLLRAGVCMLSACACASCVCAAVQLRGGKPTRRSPIRDRRGSPTGCHRRPRSSRPSGCCRPGRCQRWCCPRRSTGPHRPGRRRCTASAWRWSGPLRSG